MSQIFSPGSLKQKTGSATDKINDKRCNSYEEDDVYETETNSEMSNQTTPGLLSRTKARSTEQSDVRAISPADSDRVFAQVMKQSHWKINTSLEGKRADFSKICSICLSDSPSYGSGRSTVSCNNPLITPCLCLGLRSHQHKLCIEDWIEQTGALSCPFCSVRYDYTRSRKSFWSYVKDCELEQDFLVSIAAFTFSLYLFLVGLSVCFHYVFASSKSSLPSIAAHTCNAGIEYQSDNQCDANAIGNLPSLPIRLLNTLKSLLGLKISHIVNDGNVGAESSLKCGRFPCMRASANLPRASLVAIQAYSDSKFSWLSLTLFCFVCAATALLFIALVSMSLNMMFRHYVRYCLWSETHSKVSVRAYSLIGARPTATTMKSKPPATCATDNNTNSNK